MTIGYYYISYFKSMPQLTIAKKTYKVTVGNIVKIYKQATESEITEGMNWYSNANQYCQEISDKTNNEISVEHVAGVTSALSIRNEWSRNKLDTFNLVVAYHNLKKVDDVSVCTFTQNKHKAIKILESSALNIDSILSGLKTQNFKRNICGDTSAITVDGHAFFIACGLVNPLSKTPSLSPKNYKLLQKVYRDATKYINKELGLNYVPMQLQAITWLVYKRLNNK